MQRCSRCILQPQPTGQLPCRATFTLGTWGASKGGMSRCSSSFYDGHAWGFDSCVAYQPTIKITSCQIWLDGKSYKYFHFLVTSFLSQQGLCESMIIILLWPSVSHQIEVTVFFFSGIGASLLGTLLRIQGDFNCPIVWMISIHYHISSSPSLFHGLSGPFQMYQLKLVSPTPHHLNAPQLFQFSSKNQVFVNLFAFFHFHSKVKSCPSYHWLFSMTLLTNYQLTFEFIYFEFYTYFTKLLAIYSLCKTYKLVYKMIVLPTELYLCWGVLYRWTRPHVTYTNWALFCAVSVSVRHGFSRVLAVDSLFLTASGGHPPRHLLPEAPLIRGMPTGP